MNEEGVWRTIKGRRIFIKNGQNPMDAIIKQKNGKVVYDDSKYKYLPEDDINAYDEYVEMSEESYNNLSKDEQYLIERYYLNNEDSWNFNEDLRTGDNADAILQDALDHACESYTTKKDMSSIRFVDFDFIRDNYGLDIARYGDVDRSKVAEQMMKYIGGVVPTRSYTSVSLNEGGNGLFQNRAVHMKINIPKGSKIFVADNVGEYEAIIGRNKQLILKDVKFIPSNIQGMENEYGKVLLTYEVGQ